MAESSESLSNSPAGLVDAAEGSPLKPEEDVGDEAEASYTTADEEHEQDLPPDFTRLWKLAAEEPSDFNSWIDLLQYCEQEDHVESCRLALIAFLERFPLCYGYWKKFVDIERRAGYHDKAREVCERGLKAIPLSVDLWIHYINLLLGTLNMNLPESVEHIRSAFQKAVATAGMDFHSDRLWDLYGEWEKEQGNLKAMTEVYDSVIALPTQLYDTHYEKMKSHLSSHSPQDILCAEEYVQVKAEYEQIQVKAKKEKSSLNPEEAEGPPGDDEPRHDDKDSEEAVQKMQEIVMARREEVYQQNAAEVQKRSHFEEMIKRPYFHVKPLDKAQLKAWHDYLDWEIAQTQTAAAESSVTDHHEDRHKRVVFLFERCLIACALYEEFWDKYVHYLEPKGPKEVRDVFHRACEIHLPSKHTIHLQWAFFEEKNGNMSEAQRVLDSLESRVPGLAAVRLRRVGMERRAGRMEAAESLLAESVEKSRHDPPLHAYYSIKLARFLFKLCKSPARARDVLQEAIELSPDNGRLYQNLLELEMSDDLQTNGGGGGVQQCVAKALAAPLPSKTKILLSQRGLQFTEDFGSTVKGVLNMYDEHQKLLKEHSTKREAETSETNDDDDAATAAEKTVKLDDEPKLTAETPQTTPTAPPTMPPVPMTTPPPTYGGYENWYQQQPPPSYGGYGTYQNPWNSYSQYYPPS